MKYQLSMTNPHDVLHHGKRAANESWTLNAINLRPNKLTTLAKVDVFLAIASYLSKVTNLKLPNLHLAPLLGVTPFDFAEIFRIRKLESLDYRVALFA